MKKIIILLLFVQYTFGQSLSLTPTELQRIGGSSYDINIRKFSSDYPTIMGYRASGTQAAPSNTASGLLLLRVGGGGYYNGTFGVTPRANIDIYSTESWTNTANGAKMSFYTTSNGTQTSVERMVIDEDGKVGIGVLNPDKAGLVVNKLVGSSSAIFGDNTSGVGIDVAWPGISFNGYYNGGRKPLINGYVGGISMDPATGLIRIYNSSASGTAGANLSQFDRLFIDNEGDVGIGIANPTASLYVARGTGLNGTAAFGGTTHTSHFNYSTAENTYIRGGKDGAKVFINDLANLGSIQVGAAITPAGYKMSVDGKLICTELDVLVTPWPDYVFKPSYNLKPIKEVEQFIKENGHLPNIPKAEVIEKSALSVGNMSKLQMEKIEELTLYLIEMNKRLETLESENTNLKAELKILKSNK